MAVVIRPMTNAFAGEASAIDCAKPLDERDVDAIHLGTARHAVLVFRDQPLTDEQQLVFTKRFGDLERYETPGHVRKRQPGASRRRHCRFFQLDAKRRADDAGR